MPNTFLTPQVVANEALMQLEANLVMAGLVYRDFDSDFDGAVGDTILVKKPATFKANDFNGKIEVQDIKEGSVPVTLDRLVDVSFKFGSKERALDIKDLSVQAIQPAMIAIADRIDKDLLNVAALSKYSVSSEAKPTKLTDFGKLANILDNNKVPTAMRNLVLCPDHRYKYLDTDLSNASFSGSTAALRNANLGVIYNFETYMDQNNLQSNAAKSGTATSFKVEGTMDATTVKLTNVEPATGTLEVGDVFVVDGHRYTVKTKATAAGGTVESLEIEEKLHKTISDAEKAYIGNAKHSMAFHKNAITLVSRTLPIPQASQTSAIATNGQGLGVRVVFGYDQTTKTEICSIDILYGIKLLEPKMLVNLVG